MKTFFVVPICFLLSFLLVSQNSRAQNPDFSGEWNINIQKTDFGGLPHSAVAYKIKIVQADGVVDLIRFLSDTSASRTPSEEKLNLNGAVTKTLLKDRTKTASIKLMDGNASLIETADYERSDPGKPNYKVTDVFSLSADKSVMTMVRTFLVGDEQNTVTAYYDRSKP